MDPPPASTTAAVSTTPQLYSRQQYATKSFWQSRYKQKPSYFDWYAQFPQLKQSFQQIYKIQKTNKILMLGCGNSKLSEQMYEQGYHNIVNIDISDTVIQQMANISEQKGYDKMKWIAMDATQMDLFGDGDFDVVIDKGTLDALISGKNQDVCGKMLRQSMRVLKKQGQFILITYGSPQGRKKFFENSLGLKSYDYYFVRVDLSSMSTLINLMRSNLGNKPLNAITKDTEAMKKSLLEYNLIKVLRRNRKNQKKYVIWSEFKEQDKEERQKLQEKAEEKVQEKLEHKEEHKEEHKGEQKRQNSQQISYNPKKQSFCYVYSISKKFGIDLPQLLPSLQIKQHFPQHQQSDPITISPSSSPNSQPSPMIHLHPSSTPTLQSLLHSLCYLRKQKIEHPSIKIYKKWDKFVQESHQNSLNLAVRQGGNNALYAYAKAVWQIQVQGNVVDVEDKIRKFQERVLEEAGLSGHPQPTVYAYLGLLYQKLQYKQKYHKFLQKYWYPTHTQLSSTCTNIHTHTYQISFPPTIPSTLISSIFLSLFPSPPTSSSSSTTPSSVPLPTPSLRQLTAGFLNLFDIRFITIFNFASMTYCDGQQVELIVRDFQKDGDQRQVNGPLVQVVEGKVELIFARIFSAL